jgi:hypothetical protein
MTTKEILGALLLVFAALQFFFSYKIYIYNKNGQHTNIKRLNTVSRIVQVSALLVVLIFIFFGDFHE